MEFRIADTFTHSLARLNGEEQKAAKLAAMDLQLNPAHPSLQFHKLEKSKDKNFCSIRVSRDVRLIVHRTEGSLLLCYVDHHDPAYIWAERRRIEVHPKTGAAQLVEIRETVQEIIVPKYIEREQSKPSLFARYSDDELLGYGVPPEWLADVRAADEDSILRVADHLPSEAAEALLDLATGSKPKAPAPLAPGQNPFTHPDAQRRFRVMSNVEELERALDYAWEKWTVFLHPAQRQLVERDYNGPARVSGSAGTGKTIVALHRAVHLARTSPHARVLLTTFSDTLCYSLSAKLRVLVAGEPRLAERIEVHAMNGIGKRLYGLAFGAVEIAAPKLIRELLDEAAKQIQANKFTRHFLWTEWDQVVDAWQLRTWEAYRDVPRLGRKTRLPEKQRALLWSIFERIQAGLGERKLVTYSHIFTRLAEHLARTGRVPFDFAVVDESQDISIAQLRFLAALGSGERNRLFFAGDLGQRIFQQPFSWKSLGIDVRGRSHTLKINYRTSHQIRMQADRLLGPEVTDVDGNKEERKGTISVFNGPAPEVHIAANIGGEAKFVSAWLKSRRADGIHPHEIGIFVRSEGQLERAISALAASGLPCKMLDEHVRVTPGHVSISTMHLAKGLEFRAVAVMACDDEVIPLQERIETVSDESDLEETYNTERHLLYVACTRARDQLLITGVDPVSEFLDDLGAKTG